MSPKWQIVLGIGAGIALAVADEAVETSHMFNLVTLGLAVISLIIGVISGQEMPRFVRALLSVLVFYWGYGMCLAGRTMEVGLTRTTVSMAIGIFMIYGALPGLAFLRLWPVRQGAVLLSALLPASFLLACAVASTEEYLFVQKYKDVGVGPTPRWTVHQHWLAYDKEHHRLDGSD